jgi:hypothetical protein
MDLTAFCEFSKYRASLKFPSIGTIYPTKKGFRRKGAESLSFSLRSLHLCGEDFSFWFTRLFVAARSENCEFSRASERHGTKMSSSYTSDPSVLNGQ